MARTHMASDESLQQIFAAVSGTTMAAAGDGRTAVLATGNEDTIDRYYNALAQKVTTAREMNVLFVDWWTANWNPNTSTYNRMLERWFGNVLDDSRVHGVKFPLFSTSNTAIGELTDDSVGLSCTPSTAAESGKDDFAGLPQFWCVEVAAEKNEDGSHTIYACQYIDDDDFVRSTNHLVWVLQKNTYVRERNEGGYRILRMRCHPSGGYEQWPQGTDRTGKTYPYIANPKYFAGMQDDGKIGGHTGLAPVNYKSHTQLVQLWRARGNQYAGASGNLLKWQERMIQLKYARKGNSGTIEGCTSYSYQYTAAIDAEGVNYFPVTTEQAANLLIDSYVAIGTHTKSTTDRNDATMHDIQTEARITRIEDINVDGTGYKAVYVDTGDTWNVVKGQTMLSTMPYGSGYNDSVRGNDGSRTNYTNGKEPGLIQKTEFQNGALAIFTTATMRWEGTERVRNCITEPKHCPSRTATQKNNRQNPPLAIRKESWRGIFLLSQILQTGYRFNGNGLSRLKNGNCDVKIGRKDKNRKVRLGEQKVDQKLHRRILFVCGAFLFAHSVVRK